KAIEYYEEQLIIVHEIGDRQSKGNALSNLGISYATLGDTHKAIALYEERIDIAREIGDVRGEGNTLSNLAKAYFDLGETSKAIKFYEQALVIIRKIGNRGGEEKCLFDLGMAYASLDETSKATEYYKLALDIAQAIGDYSGQVAALKWLGSTNSNKQDAIKYYEHIIEVSVKNNNRQIEIEAHANLVKLFFETGNNEKAFEHIEKIQIVSNSTNRVQNTKSELRLLRAFLCHSSRDKDKARELHRTLNERGYDVWIDEKKLIPGQKWELEIEQAIKSSDVILVCLSSLSINSESYMHKEIKTALDRAENMPEGEIFIIPCRLDEIEVPQRLKELQWVDLFLPDGLSKLEMALLMKARKLGRTVKQS
ncbi:MAG: tetratricopeptide repeat protein, partial [Chloroflexota bacterium]